MSGGILNAVAGPLKSGLSFSYGLFIMIFYGVVSICAGYFFTPPSEKELLELQLGMFDSGRPIRLTGRDTVRDRGENEEEA